MKAAVINSYGANDVVEIRDIPIPEPSREQMLVEVYAAGVNPADWKIREGMMKGTAIELPMTLGGDFSGVVKEVGQVVTDFKVGDEVFGQAMAIAGNSGSFAEYTAVYATSVALKPATIAHIKAAALPLTSVSAYQGLIEHMNLSKGQKILIHGGAGGIGSFAIQLAKKIGAYVVTTVGDYDMEYAKELEADEIIDFKHKTFQDMVKECDAVFDTVGGETYAHSFQVLKKGGVLVSMLEQPNHELMEKYGVKAIGQFTQVTKERLEKVAELVDKYTIKEHIDAIFTLDQAKEALEHVQGGHPQGKVVLEMKKSI